MEHSSFIQVAAEFALRQHGVVGRRQLIESGIPSSTIADRVKGGYLYAVYPGAYAVGRRRLSWNGILWASLIAAGEGAVLGYRTAATAWGFMDFRRTVEILRPKFANNARSGEELEDNLSRVSMHVRRTTRLPSADLGCRGGLPLTTVSRTLLDLASVLTEKRFERAFLEADRLGLIDEDELSEMFSRSRGLKGGGAFRDCAERRLPDIRRTRSVLEALFIGLVREAGLPEPEINRVVSGLEVDLLWREAGIVVELDGYEFHRGRAAWERDLDRANRLLIDGWEVLRFTWAMVERRPEAVIADLKKALTQAEPRNGPERGT